jgi:hypothetical protein
LLVVLHAPQTHAWGRVGHKVVCEIAWSELTQVTKAAVTDLLAEDPAGATFAESCVWADEEVQKKARQLDHFINVPRYYYEIRSGQCRLGDRCLFSAIDHEVNVLSYSSDSRQRLDALRYLGHWVGDIHQPLHVSYADDQGGNKIDESGPCSFSLHSVWDSCVIAQMLGGDHMQIAQTLRGAVDSDERTRWIDTMVVDWAEESYLIARDQQVQYCELRGRVCWYDSSHERWREGLPEKVVKVDDVYLAVAAPVVSERLQQAGVRLGALLNRIFDPPVFD